MSTPEGKVKLAIKIYLKGLEPALWFFMPVSCGFGISGIPDFIGCYKGRFFSIESKRGGGKIRPWQTRVRELIQAAGGIALLVDNVNDVKAVLDAL